MRKLDLKSVHVRAFPDASFATNHNENSRLGHIVLLCDKQDTTCVLHYASYRSRRVASTVLVAEICAFADEYDFVYWSKRDLECILDKTLPLEIYTDSRSLFDVITKCS